eukprot:Stramenopile-MAST_4_protein_3615
MAPPDDFYELLGLPSSATHDEIVAAYRTLARKYHPDRKPFGDKAMFQRLSEAYRTLSDPVLRKQYDQSGPTERAKRTADDIAEMFRNVFSARSASPNAQARSSFVFGPGSRQPRAPPNKREPWHQVRQKTVPLLLSVEDVKHGRSSTFRVKRKRVQYPAGISADNCYQACQTCECTGQMNSVRRMGPMIQQYSGPCRLCRGLGWILCDGVIVVSETVDLDVYVEPGMEQGDEIVFPGASDELVGFPPADLIFVVCTTVDSSWSDFGGGGKSKL